MWNYNPNNDDHTGDDWNGENFSWFSQKRALPPSWLDHSQTSPTLDNGGRILRAVVRPYAAKTAGIPLRCEYEINTGEFTYEWAVPHASSSSSSSLSASFLFLSSSAAARAAVRSPPPPPPALPPASSAAAAGGGGGGDERVGGALGDAVDAGADASPGVFFNICIPAP